MVINMEIALMTPPVGLNLYVLATVSKTPLSVVIKGVNPFLVLLLGLLAPDHLCSGSQPLVAAPGLWIVDAEKLEPKDPT